MSEAQTARRQAAPVNGNPLMPGPSYESPEKSRTRMVSFRLTAAEYDRFHQLCLARGLRNVSEMIRAAVNHMVADSHPSPFVHALDTRLSELETRFRTLALIVERIHHANCADDTYRQAAAR